MFARSLDNIILILIQVLGLMYSYNVYRYVYVLCMYNVCTMYLRMYKLYWMTPCVSNWLRQQTIVSFSLCNKLLGTDYRYLLSNSFHRKQIAVTNCCKKITISIVLLSLLNQVSSSIQSKFFVCVYLLDNIQNLNLKFGITISTSTIFNK